MGRIKTSFEILLLFVFPLASFTQFKLVNGFHHNQNSPPPFLKTTSITIQQAFPENVEAEDIKSIDHNEINNGCNIESIRQYTELAINLRGTTDGLEALSILNDVCQCRLPFDFDNNSSKDNNGSLSVALFRQLIPPKVATEFLKQVRVLEKNYDWLYTTNPDSVDGLPSFHVNLVSHGKPAFPSTETTESPTTFQKGLQNLLGIVQPYIYKELLPEVQNFLNNSTNNIRISDIFFRRYGQDIGGGVTRNGISAHYDVFSRVTAVIALDDVAADGRNGLYTTQVDETGATSNHAALRRFFPLRSGDAVLHTWDVLHGVDVEPGLDRTSLIIWFTEENGSKEDESKKKKNDIESVAPWLLSHHPDLDCRRSNDVAQFVLASAMYSLDDETEDESKDRLYLNSAAKGNLFALTRMGSLIEEDTLDFKLKNEALDILEKLRSFSSLPEPIKRFANDSGKKTAVMAMRFWFEASVRGNALAQRSLADEILFQASQLEYDEDSYLLAAIFFALAGQQGDEEASESLKRLLDADLSIAGGFPTVIVD